MKNFIIFTDATIDFTEELVKETGISVVPMDYFMDEKQFTYNGTNFDCKGFYNAVSSGAAVRTTQINPSTFEDAFRPVLKGGNDILYISLSSALSGSYNSSLIAISELKEAFPERKIIAVDSLGGTVGEGMLAFLASRFKKEGKTLEETADWLLKNRYHICIFLTVDDLYHLKRGGRISSTTALLGSALNIKPILNVTNEGKLVPFSKARGKKGAESKLIELISELIIPDACDLIFISHADNSEAAESLEAKLKEKFPKHRIIITEIGPVIGSHTGQKAMCLIFFGSKR
ncbi:MAG: DegV family protein [Lachnospiraceae bacterium]|nr:DegV family protein [Lachnospiraceae bacterium]